MKIIAYYRGGVDIETTLCDFTEKMLRSDDDDWTVFNIAEAFGKLMEVLVSREVINLNEVSHIIGTTADEIKEL